MSSLACLFSANRNWSCTKYYLGPPGWDRSERWEGRGMNNPKLLKSYWLSWGPEHTKTVYSMAYIAQPTGLKAGSNDIHAFTASAGVSFWGIGQTWDTLPELAEPSGL
uniref:Uncharacterized protein n=1 Tax=Pelusios castaneus TaxID=367368 RepID=A0A8C8S4K1_9SAUR